jgi:hypothetical protein
VSSVLTEQQVAISESAGWQEARTAPAPQPVFEECPDAHWYGGRSCKKRSCSVCGARWAKRWSRVFFHNLQFHGRDVAMITITAPGAEALPWDTTSCAIKKPHRCEGPRGCKVDGAAAREWADTAPHRWTQLRQAARIATKRRMGAAPLLLGRVWEPQKRGVPHLHVMVSCGGEDELEVADAFRAELARLAAHYGFGFVDRELNPGGPRQAAGYVAEYLTGRQRRARARKTTIRENIANPRMPRSLLWISPNMTRVTKVTMRTLRYVGWYYGALRGTCQLLPRLFGEKIVAVATALTYLESTGLRGPPQDRDELFVKHFHALRVMRQVQEPYSWSPA